MLLQVLPLVAWACSTRAWDHASPADLEKALQENDYTLVAFVAPSEMKSQSFESEWLNAATESKPGLLLSINCESDSSACQDHDTNAAFPSIKLFQTGKATSKYQGPRRTAAMLKFVSRARRPTVSVLDAEGLGGFKTVDETVFIAYLTTGDEESRTAFADVAEKYHDEFSFGAISDAATVEAQGLKAPSVVCYKVIDGDTLSFSAFSELGALDKFVAEASRQVVGELTTQNWQRLLDRGWPMVYLFAPSEAERLDLRKKLYKFAKDYYDSLTTVTVDPYEFPDLQARMGLELGVFPAGVVHQLSKDRIYPYPRGQPYTSASLQKWGLDVYQGRVKPWTPPGVTTSYDDLGPTKVATRKVSVRNNWPGAKIKIAGRDEL